jgi:hypothetical protein
VVYEGFDAQHNGGSWIGMVANEGGTSETQIASYGFHMIWPRGRSRQQLHIAFVKPQFDCGIFVFVGASWRWRSGWDLLIVVAIMPSLLSHLDCHWYPHHRLRNDSPPTHFWRGFYSDLAGVSLCATPALYGRHTAHFA